MATLRRRLWLWWKLDDIAYENLVV